MILDKSIPKIFVCKDAYLEPLNNSHISENYLLWLKDKEVTCYTEQRFFNHDIESVKDFVRKTSQNEDELCFALIADKTHIGNFKLSNINFNHSNAVLSFLIGDKSYWGKGLASKSIRAICEFAKMNLKLNKINASSYANNHASLRVFEKNNFRIEGKRLNDRVFEGKRIDLVMVGKDL